jgi:hypothetical protein
MARRFFYKIIIKMQLKGKEGATYSSLHLCDKITRVSITVCLLDSGSRGFRFRRRAEDLVAEEIEGS